MFPVRHHFWSDKQVFKALFASLQGKYSPPAPAQEEGTISRLISGGNYEKAEKKKEEEKKVENVKEKGMKTKDNGKLKLPDHHIGAHDLSV
jgi:hypothetical protein